MPKAVSLNYVPSPVRFREYRLALAKLRLEGSQATIPSLHLFASINILSSGPFFVETLPSEEFATQLSHSLSLCGFSTKVS